MLRVREGVGIVKDNRRKVEEWILLRVTEHQNIASIFAVS